VRLRGQTTTEYMLTIAVIVIAVAAVFRIVLDTVYHETGSLAGSLRTSLTDDGIQER
jgi:uncharacterized protein (UPF0333 family)